jgi:uncharacterized protein Yka (UPF0111/DUF47 family)
MRRPLSWFLPDSPDVLGMLRQQAALTIEGMDALVSWVSGDQAAADRVREAEHRADEVKRALRVALRDAFVTPVSQEDLYVLSERLDAVLGGAKDAVRESEVLAMAPDPPMVTMAALLSEGVGHLAEAFGRLAAHGGDDRGVAATDAADRAVKAQRQLEKTYRNAMRALLEIDDLRVVMGRRELYRRFSRISETIVQVADRVWYASVREH